MEKQNSEKVLGLFELTSIAVGNVIGGGIMSVVGVAIGLTGRSVVIALIICSLMTLISIMPKIFTSATLRMNGGEYTLAALMGGKFFAGSGSPISSGPPCTAPPSPSTPWSWSPASTSRWWPWACSPSSSC